MIASSTLRVHSVFLCICGTARTPPYNMYKDHLLQNYSQAPATCIQRYCSSLQVYILALFFKTFHNNGNILLRLLLISKWAIEINKIIYNQYNTMFLLLSLKYYLLFCVLSSNYVTLLFKKILTNTRFFKSINSESIVPALELLARLMSQFSQFYFYFHFSVST